MFPPALIGFAVAGAGIGELSGHLWQGLSRADVKELGELIDEGEAALLVVAASPLADTLRSTDLHAERNVTRKLTVDWDDLNLDEVLSEAAVAVV